MAWIVPAGSFAAVFAAGKGGLGYSEQNHICGSWGKDSDAYLMVQICVALLIPGVAISLSYIWIYIYVKRHFKAQQNIAINFSKEGKAKWSI